MFGRSKVRMELLKNVELRDQLDEQEEATVGRFGLFSELIELSSPNLQNQSLSVWWTRMDCLAITVSKITWKEFVDIRIVNMS